MRLLIGKNNQIDPTSIHDYMALDGYRPLAKALSTMTPESLIEVTEQFNNWLVESVDCANCMVLDLDEVFGGDAALFYDDVHFNNNGARLYAETAFRFLGENKLLPVDR